MHANAKTRATHRLSQHDVDHQQEGNAEHVVWAKRDQPLPLAIDRDVKQQTRRKAFIETFAGLSLELAAQSRPL